MLKTIALPLLLLTSIASSQAIGTTYNDLGAFNTASGAYLHETFETAVPKNTPLASITLNGIKYEGAPGHNVYVAQPGFSNFGAGVGVTTSSVLTANGNENFLGVVLAASPYAVGMDVYLNGLGPATLEFYNGNTLLESIVWTTGDNIVFAGLISPAPITSFHFFSTSGAVRNTGIDNVRLAVPEAGPGLALAVLPALALLAGYVRRKS